MLDLHSSKIGDSRSVSIQKIIFTFSWIIGLFLGYRIALCILPETKLFICRIIETNTNIVGFLLVHLITLLLSAYLFYRNIPALVLPIIFLKAILYSFMLSAISLTFGDIGWLLSRLYVFSDSCTVVVLLFFWIKCINCNINIIKRHTALSITAVCFICYFDYACLSPFLVTLFNH